MTNYAFNSNVNAPIKYLKRTHIYDLLKEAVQNPLTVVIAGAGYGKTKTIHEFLREYDATTIWLKLTAFDNIGSRLWGNIVNVISLYNEESASRLEMLGFPDTAIKFDIFLSHISEVMLPCKKYIIVFDDFHLVHEKTTLLFVERVANACLPNLSIILISRSEPEINIAGLSDKGLLTMISEKDLRFSKSDMLRYYELHDIHIPRQTVSKIYNDTCGWIMAIRLIELSLKKGVAHEDFAITAMKQNIFKLMESEIYSILSEDVQKFLVKLSLFNSLPLELVNLLASNDERLMASVLSVNSFIHYDSFSNLYNIHNLFLDFLTKKQTMLTNEEKTECYLKVAEWSFLNGYRIDAITYYEKTGNYGDILKIALILPHGSREEALLILDILDRAPKSAYEQEPLLEVLHARAQWFLGKRKEYTQELEALVTKYEALPQSRENLLILSEIYLNIGLSGYYLSCTGANDFSFSDFFKRAYNCISNENTILTVRYIQDVGPFACRISSEKKNDMDNYIEAVSTAAFYAPKVMCGAMCGLDDLARAELAYFKNSMKSSEKFAHQAFYKAREARQYIIEIRAIFYLIRIAVAAGNYAKVLDLTNQLEAEKFPNGQTLYDIVIGWFYSAIGEGHRVANWIKSSFKNEELSFISSGVETSAKIKYCLSEKRYYEFLLFWEVQKDEFAFNSINSFLFGKIAMTLAKAVSLYHTDAKDEAVNALQEAYRLAEPNSLTTQFIELGNDMVSLVKFAMKKEGCTIPGEWLSSIFRKSSTYAKRLLQVASEYKRADNPGTGAQPKLTKRELEFLNETCRGMSRAEIAANYGLSPNYVKNKLQTIYAKLGASNPMDAIRIATLAGFIK